MNLKNHQSVHVMLPQFQRMKECPFSPSAVCQLWKMLAEQSAPWRHVPDILPSMYGFYLGK